MTLTGAMTEEPAIIFPEGAALVIGFWVLAHPGWSVSRWRLIVLPPACAMLGVALTWLPWPRWVGEAIALTVALLALQVLRSRLAPSVSAAMFPVVFDVHTWLFPVSVLVICVTIAAGDGIVWHRGTAVRGGLPARWPWSGVGGFWLVALVWIAVGALFAVVPAAALAPPLFVSCLEWITGSAWHLPTGLRRWGVVTGAALAGSTAVWLCPFGAVAGPVGAAVTMLLLLAVRDYHPPAVAISLIPLVIPASTPWAFTGAIALGFSGLYGLAHVAQSAGRRLTAVEG